MAGLEAEIVKRGARIVAIGQGSGGRAARFCARLGIDFPCLGDPGHAAYERYELPRARITDVTWKPFLRAPIEGLRQTLRADLVAGAAPGSDVRQLGGVALVDARGRMRLVYRQRMSSDLPAARPLLEALEGLRAEAAG